MGVSRNRPVGKSNSSAAPMGTGPHALHHHCGTQAKLSKYIIVLPFHFCTQTFATDGFCSRSWVAVMVQTIPAPKSACPGVQLACLFPHILYCERPTGLPRCRLTVSLPPTLMLLKKDNTGDKTRISQAHSGRKWNPSLWQSVRKKRRDSQTAELSLVCLDGPGHLFP